VVFPVALVPLFLEVALEKLLAGAAKADFSLALSRHPTVMSSPLLSTGLGQCLSICPHAGQDS